MVAGRILFLDLDLHGCCLCTYSLSYEVLGLVFSICILFYKNRFKRSSGTFNEITEQVENRDGNTLIAMILKIKM